MKTYLRRKMMAERYGVDERTVSRMVADGRLPSPKYLGRIPVWDEEDLEAHEKKQFSKSNMAA